MKLKFRLIAIFVLFILFINFLSMNTFAMNNVIIDDQYLKPEQFDNREVVITHDFGSGISIKSIVVSLIGKILIILRIIAVGWAIVMAFMIAIKYMISAPNMKSQLKADLPTYFIGAALLFGSTGILSLIKYFIDDYF